MHMRAGLALLLAPIPALAAPQAAFVIIGENGQATARAITGADRCPDIIIDGRSLPMVVRAPSETVPQRPTASTPENSKPSEFPVLTCDAVLPVRARTASISGQQLPAVSRNIRRIVVIGDTGCRLKAADGAYQACNDPAAYVIQHPLHPAMVVFKPPSRAPLPYSTGTQIARTSHRDRMF